MTENQDKFIFLLYKYGEMTSEECCRRLKIKKTQPYNTYYSELCFFLPYPNEDEEFDGKVHLDMYSIEEDPLNERARFSLTQAGRDYIESKRDKRKSNRQISNQSLMATISVIVAVVAIIVTIILAKK